MREFQKQADLDEQHPAQELQNMKVLDQQRSEQELQEPEGLNKQAQTQSLKQAASKPVNSSSYLPCQRQNTINS